MMTRSCLMFCFFFLGSIQGIRVEAELVFSFGRDGEPGVADFVVEPGTELHVGVFVSEVGGQLLNSSGIGTARFRLEVTGEGVTHGPLESFEMGPGFRAVGSNSRSDLVRTVDMSGTAEGLNVVPVQAPSGSRSVFLGTAMLRIDPAFDGSVLLSAAQVNLIDVSLGNSVFNFGSVSPGMATVTAVPEPGGLKALCVVGLAAFLLLRISLADRQSEKKV